MDILGFRKLSSVKRTMKYSESLTKSRKRKNNAKYLPTECVRITLLEKILFLFLNDSNDLIGMLSTLIHAVDCVC